MTDTGGVMGHSHTWGEGVSLDPWRIQFTCEGCGTQVTLKVGSVELVDFYMKEYLQDYIHTLLWGPCEDN